ncbi:hypothetical protein Acr_00g0077460 [Actinidia rufa]|uniref:Uncharacterized protein n=1 Tax=Actinidia rufa TaxID=165716 RepID=A0A7J0DTL8_9ERIC|nr:hypothetical protein Acr_00g0077460 [Actinidia rufa]
MVGGAKETRRGWASMVWVCRGLWSSPKSCAKWGYGVGFLSRIVVEFAEGGRRPVECWEDVVRGAGGGVRWCDCGRRLVARWLGLATVDGDGGGLARYKGPSLLDAIDCPTNLLRRTHSSDAPFCDVIKLQPQGQLSACGYNWELEHYKLDRRCRHSHLICSCLFLVGSLIEMKAAAALLAREMKALSN